jgi:phosphate transport system substrate-binding protein
VIREDGSGTRDAFNTIVMGNSAATYGTATILAECTSTGQLLTTMGLTSTTGAIGYVNLNSKDHLGANVKWINVEGVEPKEDTVRSELTGGTGYKISRSLFLITLGEPTEMAKTFIDWIKGAAGQDIVRKEGFVPLNA